MKCFFFRILGGNENSKKENNEGEKPLKIYIGAKTEAKSFKSSETQKSRGKFKTSAFHYSLSGDKMAKTSLGLKERYVVRRSYVHGL